MKRRVAVVLAVAFGIGCGSDGDSPIRPPEPGRGQVIVDIEPDDVGIRWTLEGPRDFHAEGAGDQTFDEVPIGEYTLTWGEAPGWITPGPSTKTKLLFNDAEITFWVNYTPAAGVLTIDVEPEGLSAPWVLTGPDSTFEEGVGTSRLIEMPPGEYQIEWGSVSLHESPDPPLQSATLDTAGTATFRGTYRIFPGTVHVDVEPDTLAAPWRLERPDGVTIDGTGKTTLEGQPPGQYTILWGSTIDWEVVGADFEESRLLPDETLRFSRGYRELPPAIIRGIEFVPIPPGSFTSTRSPGECETNEEMGVDSVGTATLTRAYEMTIHEITWRDYVTVLDWAHRNGYVEDVSGNGHFVSRLDGGSTQIVDEDWFRPLGSTDRPILYDAPNGFLYVLPSTENRPVHGITKKGALAFCDWMNLIRGWPRSYDHATWEVRGGNPYELQGYRLPTSVEWEYACRAGTSTAFHSGDWRVDCAQPEHLEEVAWTQRRDRPQDVGLLLPNSFGLYDMHGNVAEWFHGFSIDVDGSTDLVGHLSADYTYTRGGSYRDEYHVTRASFQSFRWSVFDASTRTSGIRVVRTLDEGS